MTPFKDLTGQRFGQLVALRRVAPRKRATMWECQCDCGKVKEIRASALTRGHSQSCGCARIKAVAKVSLKHGHAVGHTSTPTYRTWQAMKRRCRKEQKYLSLEIKVCKEWENEFPQFLKDMGQRPPGMTIDRIDGKKGYYPSNCRWATARTQGNNRGTNRVLTFEGKTQTLAEWARELKITPKGLACRLDFYGWTLQEALTTPPGNAGPLSARIQRSSSTTNS